MNLKKLLCLLLALGMAVSLMAACGKETEEDDNPPVDPVVPNAFIAPDETPMQTSDPGADDTLNILMIGNSFCYYYPDELWGMLDAAGIKARICNVYASGCRITQHWDGLLTDDDIYEVFATYDENGRQVENWWTLRQCLQQQNWDIISLQEDSSCLYQASAAQSFASNETRYQDIFGYLQFLFPQSDYYWHQVWSFQVGYNGGDFPGYSQENQRDQYMRMQQLSLTVCNTFSLKNINSGDAWQIVRDGGYDNLCARLGVNGGLGDNRHEGDIGGGQYLNACVWFECITGQSCVGNTWRPTEYTLDEDLIKTLQEAAHEAVELQN